MEEVIAKKKSGLMASYILLIILGTIISAFGVLALIFSDVKALGGALLAFGLVVLGVGLAWIIVFARFPKTYVTFKDGKLYLGKDKVICSPSEVDYCHSSSYGLDGAIFNYGKLIISVAQHEYKFWFVRNVSNAVNRINELKAECQAIETAQKEIAARNAAENAETTEK